MRHLLAFVSLMCLSACGQMFAESGPHKAPDFKETVIMEVATRVGETKYIWIEKQILVTVLNSKGTVSKTKSTQVFACVADTGKCVPVDLPCGLSGEWCEVMRQVDKPSENAVRPSSPQVRKEGPVDGIPTTAVNEKGTIVPATGEATRKAIKACFANYPTGPKEASVRVRLQVSAAGQVEEVQILTEDFAGTQVGSCLKNAFALLKYTPTYSAHSEPLEYQP